MSLTPDTITIYSVGLLGGSLGLALKHSGYNGTIIGLSSENSIQTSKELGCIDEGYDYSALQEVIGRTKILFLCSPINAIIETIATLSKMELPEGLIITDVGSTKESIEVAARILPPHVHFIGGHPMAGSEKSGPGASDPYLFQNAIYVITTTDNEAVFELHHDFARFLEAYLGCRTFFLNAHIHDVIAATVSHIPHLLAVALVHLARQTDDKIPDTLTLAAGGFRDMTRIASSSYTMWHDILTTNKTACESQLDILITILSDMKKHLHSDSLKDYFDQSKSTRSRISTTSKGFIHPLSEILVRAKDQPGFIASIATILANEKINIKDIEVVKVREGEGGTIRLAFDSSQIAKKAIEILSINGFTSRERI
jgi:prephenate dehydrogenase